MIINNGVCNFRNNNTYHLLEYQRISSNIQRLNAIIVVVYIIFLFPIAYLHMFILGVWGSSKKQRMLAEAKDKAELEKLIEKEKEKI